MFQFRLSLALGIPRRLLLKSIDSEEYSYWLAMSRIEYIGEQRSDYRTGIIASLLANIHSSNKSKEYTPLDFMPFERKETKVKTMAKRLKKALGFNRGNT